MTITELVRIAHGNAIKKGFYGDFGDDKRNFGEIIALIHSELSECLEAHRTDKIVPDDDIARFYAFEADWDNQETIDNFEANVKDSWPDEIGDAVIRIADMAGANGIDLESFIIAKMKYNATREKLHGKRY